MESLPLGDHLRARAISNFIGRLLLEIGFWCVVNIIGLRLAEIQRALTLSVAVVRPSRCRQSYFLFEWVEAKKQRVRCIPQHHLGSEFVWLALMAIGRNCERDRDDLSKCIRYRPADIRAK